MGVRQVKKEVFDKELLRTFVQLESALTAKKPKSEMRDVDEEEELSSKQKAYEIVTDSEEWSFVEYTMHEDETVSFKMSWLSESLDFGGNWKDDAKNNFAKTAWLWSLMRDEIPARESYSRKPST